LQLYLSILFTSAHYEAATNNATGKKREKKISLRLKLIRRLLSLNLPLSPPPNGSSIKEIKEARLFFDPSRSLSLGESIAG